jgi:hypothetical protein
MASRLGTCKHAFQIQEAYVVGDWPGAKPERVDSSDMFLCQFLDTLSALPPPIMRKNGSFELREGDCEACPFYEPALPDSDSL